ncbi:MAG TPA: dihydropteroate synthase [Terriglobia bacterium]|nr:dihydropteroate synthase [Terriglobia bacterium]
MPRRARLFMNARRTYRINVGGRVVCLGPRTLVMGVLNVTPDSFSDGGRFLNRRQAIRHALEMASQGADWIDIGGESTRPGAEPVSEKEELRRVLPVIEGIRERLPALPISIDTTKAEVAERAIRAGANILNDVSGLRFDKGLAEVAHRHNTPLILMHLRGRPATMQQRPFTTSIFRSLNRGLGWSIRRATALGVLRSQLIIDPGLGFGKSRRQNFEILARLGELQRYRLPVLVGASRKSFMQAVVAGEGLDPARAPTAKQGKSVEIAAKLALKTQAQYDCTAGCIALDFGDAAAAAAAVLAGAHIVRVHHVAAIVPALRVADTIRAATE